jgi:hypothetical protein
MTASASGERGCIRNSPPTTAPSSFRLRRVSVAGPLLRLQRALAVLRAGRLVHVRTVVVVQNLFPVGEVGPQHIPDPLSKRAGSGVLTPSRSQTTLLMLYDGMKCTDDRQLVRTELQAAVNGYLEDFEVLD